MQYQAYKDFIDLLYKTNYSVTNHAFDESNHGNWYIEFKSSNNGYKLLWDGEKEIIAFYRMRFFGGEQLTFACTKKNWTPKDLLFYIESNSFFKRSKHDIDLERQYPPLSKELKEKLLSIEPSKGHGLLYYPCEVMLKDSMKYENVLFTDSHSFGKVWKIWPSINVEGKEINVSDIVDLKESKSRLPAVFAHKLYQAGETRMGFIDFTVEFKDGTNQAYCSPGIIDFINYPSGKSNNDIMRVLPHKGIRKNQMDEPEFFWCLFKK